MHDTNHSYHEEHPKHPVRIKLIVFLAFGVAALGWLNALVFSKSSCHILFSYYTGNFLIMVFGIWRVWVEKNPYTRKRLAVLVFVVATVYTILPYFNIPDPFIAYPPGCPTLPSFHLPGTLSFFILLFAVLLFGRRVKCGWGCSCAGLRETVGFAFRPDTLHGKTAWKFRHIKWIPIIFWVFFIYLTFYPMDDFSFSYYGSFMGYLTIVFYSSLFLAPFTGHRNYCRYLCPYGTTYGLLSKIGFYRINYDRKSCDDCGHCDKVCDMGIPVAGLGKKHGRIDVIECMGCGRCVTECHTNSLSFYDVRDVIFPGRIRNREFLLGNNRITKRKAELIIIITGILLVVFLIAYQKGLI